jgi:carbamoyltransferase
MTSDRFAALFGRPVRRADEPIEQFHMDIAASVQAVTEAVLLALTRGLATEFHVPNLCLAGGVALNCVANGRILRAGRFARLWVQPAAGDAGGALGAALAAYHQHAGHLRVVRAGTDAMAGSYLGPSYSQADIERRLRQVSAQWETAEDDRTMIDLVAAALARGEVVGWFQGRMEFGPRALGNRSFIADPRRNDMRDLLNHKVKLREWFRPLAPSMQEEASEEIFGRPHHDPFMVTVLHVAEEKRGAIPAVVHVDGTARPQTVSRRTNPRYWNLIDEFARLTGVPMVLNTSFNIQEPIVCTPQNAINTFQGANFDGLVLENHLVLRR